MRTYLLFVLGSYHKVFHVFESWQELPLEVKQFASFVSETAPPKQVCKDRFGLFNHDMPVSTIDEVLTFISNVQAEHNARNFDGQAPEGQGVAQG